MRRVVGFLALLVIVFVVYRMIRRERFTTLKENTARLYFFHTEWCGHCKTTLPEWMEAEAYIKDQPKYGKTTLTAISVNPEKETELADEMNVHAYPSVRLETVHGIREMDGRITKQSLLAFVRTHLGQEESRNA